MQLNKHTLTTLTDNTECNIPAAGIFNLPEKVLQFGTGVLLRGLPDFYIDKANKQQVFNGRVVVVKSTGKNVKDFAEQDGLYTHCIKGLENGVDVDTTIINASISRVLAAQTNWPQIVELAESEDMQIIISNTTEVGIELNRDDDIQAAPPTSFPAKLLAFLHRRYVFFKGRPESGMVIIPTELIVDNATKLKQILNELAVIYKLGNDFINWLNSANDFCNSLVDRIVPGALGMQEKTTLKNKSGYTDELAIMSEPYSLWAIESGNKKTIDILSFCKADDSVVITSDITKYRELKLRLLNGTHTFSCGLAFLAGFNLVYQAMQDEAMKTFINSLLQDELVPCITGEDITINEAIDFSNKVTDRFSNPFIQHNWINICMNYSAKMKMRNVPLLVKYYHQKNKTPLHMAAGFAAYITFMQPLVISNGVYYGSHNERQYKIDDVKAGLFYELWQKHSVDTIAEHVLSNQDLWGTDLTGLPGFTASVNYFMQQFKANQFKYVLTRLSQDVDNRDEV